VRGKEGKRNLPKACEEAMPPSCCHEEEERPAGFSFSEGEGGTITPPTGKARLLL